MTSSSDDADAVRVFDTNSMDWHPFLDPHLPDGERAALVKELGTHAMIAYFPPGFTAPEHSHPGATTYFVLWGAMDFGDGHWLSTGHARIVPEDHVYGPERAHPTFGCVFLIVSQQPVAISWKHPVAAVADRPLGL